MVTPTIIITAALSLCENKTPPLIGYTVTKKIGKANVRNLTKRRMRSAVHKIQTLFLDNTEYVLIGRHNTATCDFKNLEKDLLWGLKKLNKLLTEAKDEKTPDSAG